MVRVHFEFTALSVASIPTAILLFAAGALSIVLTTRYYKSELYPVGSNGSEDPDGYHSNALQIRSGVHSAFLILAGVLSLFMGRYPQWTHLVLLSSLALIGVYTSGTVFTCYRLTRYPSSVVDSSMVSTEIAFAVLWVLALVIASIYSVLVFSEARYIHKINRNNLDLTTIGDATDALGSSRPGFMRSWSSLNDTINGAHKHQNSNNKSITTTHAPSIDMSGGSNANRAEEFSSSGSIGEKPLADMHSVRAADFIPQINRRSFTQFPPPPPQGHQVKKHKSTHSLLSFLSPAGSGSTPSLAHNASMTFGSSSNGKAGGSQQSKAKSMHQRSDSYLARFHHRFGSQSKNDLSLSKRAADFLKGLEEIPTGKIKSPSMSHGHSTSGAGSPPSRFSFESNKYGSLVGAADMVPNFEFDSWDLNSVNVPDRAFWSIPSSDGTPRNVSGGSQVTNASSVTSQTISSAGFTREPKKIVVRKRDEAAADVHRTNSSGRAKSSVHLERSAESNAILELEEEEGILSALDEAELLDSPVHRDSPAMPLAQYDRERMSKMMINE